MITLVLRTARGMLYISILAVFFSTSTAHSDSSLVSLEESMSRLIIRLSHSVVTVESSNSVTNNYVNGTSDEAVVSLVSSGVIIDTAGHILTAASSVLGRDDIKIIYNQLTTTARPVAIDYQNGLALLKADLPIGLPVEVSLAPPLAGQMVVALGNSYGINACPTIGFCAGNRPSGEMQFTAGISAGTIGGGVFNLSGSLLGLIIGGIGDSDRADVGLAVPSTDIPEIVYHLMNHGDRTTGFLGIRTSDIEIIPAIELVPANFFSSISNQQVQVIERGIVITDVVPFSPAASAGLSIGDLVYSVNGNIIQSAVQLMDIVRYSQPGNVLELAIIRKNTPSKVRLTIGTGGLVQMAGSMTFGFTRGEIQPDSVLNHIRQLKQEIWKLENRLMKSGR